MNVLLAPDSVQNMILVSPPVALLDFGRAGGTIPNLGLVITGGCDEFAPPAEVKAMVTRWNPRARLEVIAGSDHFYAGDDRKLTSLIGAHLAEAR